MSNESIVFDNFIFLNYFFIKLDSNKKNKKERGLYNVLLEWKKNI